MKKLILISGKARCGKDTASNYLMERLADNGVNCFHLDMTGELKGALSKLINKPVSWIEENKDQEYYGTTVRAMLQRLGNDIMKRLSTKLLWCNENTKIINDRNADITLMSGMRLPDEIDYFKKMHTTKDCEVLVLKIKRLNSKGDEYCGLSEEDKYHETELAVDLVEADHDIVAKDVAELLQGVDEFIELLKKGDAKDLIDLEDIIKECEIPPIKTRSEVIELLKKFIKKHENDKQI